MSDLVSRVLAAIERAESEARHTEPGPWAVWPSDMPGEFVVARMNERTGEQDPDRVATTHGLYCAEQNARFIAHNDPAAVLRRCAAEKAILKEHAGTEVASLDHGTWGQEYIACRTCAVGPRMVVYPCPTVKHLAAGYGISVEEETT